jgi:anti-sigma-K factor RskA
MDHERFDELKEAYVLGALTGEERREFEEYLASHPERQAEVEELGVFARLLALSPSEQEPPPELRRRIMDVVEAEAGDFHAGRPPAFARLVRSVGARSLALGAAATLLLIGLLSWNLLLQGEVREMHSQVHSLQASRDSRAISLEGSGPAREAQVQLITLKDGRAVLLAENMPSIPENKTFEIWVIHDVPEPSGLFEPTEDPIATVVENPVHGAKAIAVTVEPEGGSPRPTTDPMLVAEL